MPAVGHVGDDADHALAGGALARVARDQQLHSRVVYVLCSGLDDVDILTPDGLVDLDHGLAVRLVVHAAAPQADVQVPAITMTN